MQHTPPEVSCVRFDTHDRCVLFAHDPVARHRERSWFDVVSLFKYIHGGDLHQLSLRYPVLTTRPEQVDAGHP